MIDQGEKDLFLIRVQRRVQSLLLLEQRGEVVLTICSGEADARRYIAEERASGPCRVWIAYIGDLSAARFVEQTS